MRPSPARPEAPSEHADSAHRRTDEELLRENDELRHRVATQSERIGKLEGLLQQRDATLQWILSSKAYRLSRSLCTALDRVRGLGIRRRGPAAESTALPTSIQGEREPSRRSVLARSLPAARSFDVICLPIIDWEFRFQRPQQLMRELARAGHRVFYVRNRFHEAHPEVELDTILTGVTGVTLPGPVALSVYRDRIAEELCEVFACALDELRRTEAIHQAIVVVDLPFWEPLAKELRRRFGWRIVYDCMDEHAGFSTNTEDMLAHEASLIAGSDLVLSTARVLTEKAKEANDSVLALPNATEYEHFATATPHEHYAALRGPVVGYYGAIHDWFDDALVAAAARLRPDWNFVLIGGTDAHDTSTLEAVPNVQLLGEKPYAQLPRWLAGFDVACIPFKDNELTRATNPVKFFEYLSGGKPVVSVPLPELEPYAELFYPARDPQTFVQAAERAMAENDDSRVEARRELGRRNTWAARGTALETALNGLFGKAAIIVVSYHGLELLQQCLESIWSNTLYPDFEVIVVDNASTEDVREYLRRAAAREPRLRIRLNDTNDGFAAANNQGLELAKDAEFVVLLNNDTIVPEGWLFRLLRYLQNPEFGLVGPVTSFAGNEAKIAVPYGDPSGIADFAYRHCARHEGEHFDVRVLAMFCVAMRRSLLDEIGPLDERYGVGMFEDDDFALRVRAAGYRTVCAEDVFVHHWGEQSFGKIERPEYQAIFAANRKAFEEKWGQSWQPHGYRDWDADESVPDFYDHFRTDLAVWHCASCGSRQRGRLTDPRRACSECGEIDLVPGTK